MDASAIVAILTEELEREWLADALAADAKRLSSSVAVFEAVLALCRKRRASVAAAKTAVLDFLAAASVDIVPVTEAELATALEAFSRYGKGQGHPAQLNMGDCFAYAVARNHRAAMLFKGGDFARTDIERARPPTE